MAWMSRLLNSARRRDVSGDIDEELQFHLDARIQDNLAAGMTADEARREALRQFGNRAAIREETRDANLVLWLETTVQDVSVAARALRKRPLFAAMALVTLALGIGANAAIFTIVRSVLLRPLPFPQPDQLYVLSDAQPDTPFWLYPGTSDRTYVPLLEANEWFDSMTTFGRAPATLTGAGEATRVVRATVTPDFFQVLRVEPMLGRAFASDEDRPGRDRVAMLSQALWRTQFGADPGVVSRTITLDGITHTVIGVLPAGFSYPTETSVWTPLLVEIKSNLSWTRPVIARLGSRHSAEQAQAGLDVFIRRIPRDRTGPEPTMRMMPLRDAVVGDLRKALLVFSGAVGFVLLIACANVANLLLMRAVSRRQEIATRLALGATRTRLIGQLLTEASLLSVGGAFIGVVLAFAAGPALLRLMPAGKLPPDIAIHMDGWVLAFTVGLSVVTGLAVGLTPAFQTTRHEPYDALREGHSPSERSHRLRHALVISEVALALVLLVGAGLLIKSFLGLRSIDSGFVPGQVMTMSVELPGTAYPTPEAMIGFHERLLESLAAIPGPSAVALVNWLPLGTHMVRGDLVADGGTGKGWAMKAGISPAYFQAMGIRLVAGRAFTDRDTAGAPGVVILSEAVARQIWPGEEAIGRRLSIESKPKPEDWLTVVGIVADVRQSGPKEAVVPAVYQPFRQVKRPFFLSYMTSVIRTTGDPVEVAPKLRTILRTIDPNLAPESMATMEDLVAGTIAESRFQTRLLGTFSLVAVLLAALGIYGVLASAVAEQRREIGIRVALGAGQSHVVGMVLGRTLALAGIGVAIGLAGALATTRALRTLLVNVESTDPTAFAAAAVLLVAVALLAAIIPARRASTVDPVVALRME